MAVGATILYPGEGRAFAIGGDPVAVKVEPEATDGRFSVIESALSPGIPGPPAHVHTDGLHEFWYVLEGELEFRVGDSTVRVGPGSFAHVPPGVVHTFSNPGAETTRFLGIFSPAGGLQMLEDFATAFPAHGGPPDTARIAEVFQQHGVELVDGA